jgi:hypothetical protein
MQYGIRVRTETHQMPWDEFKDLLAGLGPDTPLGRIVRIRTEKDEKVLKNYTPEMNKIRSDWQQKIAKEKSKDDVDKFLEQMKSMFIKMAK